MDYSNECHCLQSHRMHLSYCNAFGIPVSGTGGGREWMGLPRCSFGLCSMGLDKDRTWCSIRKPGAIYWCFRGVNITKEGPSRILIMFSS